MIQRMYIAGDTKLLEFSLQDLPTKVIFVGSITFEPWKKLWKTWAPGKCKTFLWLALRNRLPHPERCPLCDQEDETVQHILTTCVFARQFWCAILQPLTLESLTPARRVSFAGWWKKAERRIPKQLKKDFNSFCILGAWTLWKHRNTCVLDGSPPNLQVAIQAFKDEANLWQFAGAKGLTTLYLELGGTQP